MRITPAILAKYWYTEGCEGCRFKRAGLSDGRNHSARCRARIMEAMDATEEGKRMRQKDEDRLNRKMQEAHEVLLEDIPMEYPGTPVDDDEVFGADVPREDPGTPVEDDEMAIGEDPRDLRARHRAYKSYCTVWGACLRLIQPTARYRHGGEYGIESRSRDGDRSKY